MKSKKTKKILQIEMIKIIYLFTPENNNSIVSIINAPPGEHLF